MNQIVIFVIQAFGGRENLDFLSQRCTGTVWEPFKPENRFGYPYTEHGGGGRKFIIQVMSLYSYCTVRVQYSTVPVLVQYVYRRGVQRGVSPLA